MKKFFAIAMVALTLMAVGCNKEKDPAKNVDKTALTTLVNECQGIINAATTDNYPQAAIDVFKKAIEDVKAAADNAATDAAVASLVSRLTDAKTTFLATELDQINPDDIIFALSFDEGKGTELKTTGKNQWTAVPL